MNAIATIDNLNSSDSQSCIVRNLSRILDLRILDIDIKNKTIHLIFDSVTAFELARRELLSIGYPISKHSYPEPGQWSKDKHRYRRSKFRIVPHHDTE